MGEVGVDVVVYVFGVSYCDQYEVIVVVFLQVLVEFVVFEVWYVDVYQYVQWLEFFYEFQCCFIVQGGLYFVVGGCQDYCQYFGGVGYIVDDDDFCVVRVYYGYGGLKFGLGEFVV